MASVTSHLSISLDGFVAGPEQSADDPFGKGGMRLPQWMFEVGDAGRGADAQVLDEVSHGAGAFIMGRRMFGGGDGAWDPSWTGWWGANPPYHAPVFVLTHHPREPLPMSGGTSFTFVTDGVESALQQARAVAGSGDVAVAGGGSVVRQYLAAGLLDELYLHIVPVLLGAGGRLLDDVGGIELEQASVVASPTVTHIRYRVVR